MKRFYGREQTPIEQVCGSLIPLRRTSEKRETFTYWTVGIRSGRAGYSHMCSHGKRGHNMLILLVKHDIYTNQRVFSFSQTTYNGYYLVISKSYHSFSPDYGSDYAYPVANRRKKYAHHR